MVKIATRVYVMKSGGRCHLCQSVRLGCLHATLEERIRWRGNGKSLGEPMLQLF